MDYEELLSKYMDHVAVCEGTDFLADHWRNDYPGFTDEEWTELQRIGRGKDG